MVTKIHKGQTKHDKSSPYVCALYPILWRHTTALCEEQTKFKLLLTENFARQSGHFTLQKKKCSLDILQQISLADLKKHDSE